MQLIIRTDSVEINGYVNAIERKSKTLHDRLGDFVERICKGAFKKAIARNDNIRLLENHNKNRDLGGTKDGNLELVEDSIGLRARAIITDKEAIQKAKNGDYIGWSFGFTDREVDKHLEDGMQVRDVKDLDLLEVSLIDRRKTPSYEGPLVSVRSDEETMFAGEVMEAEFEVVEAENIRGKEPGQNESVAIDYSEYESMIAEMKGEKRNEQRAD